MERDESWIASMQSTSALGCKDEHIRHRADTIYILVMAGRILSMQTGFAMLESAYARPMNSANIMMKNLLDLLLGAVVFYLFGYEIAFGRQTQLDGDSQFDFAIWFLHFAYATTAATITSGALAGRVAFIPYLLLSTVITGAVYPVAVRWTWGGGWLKEWGYIDFAGSSIVHLVGAVSACVAVCICGPRIGRYPQYRPWSGVSRKVFAEHNEADYYEVPRAGAERAIYAQIKAVSNPVQLLFGIFLLITGFLAFNPAATFSTTRSNDLVAARSTVVTLLMTSGGSLACFVASLVRTRSLVVSIPDFTTAVLGSMVASCACCNVLPPLVGVLVGFVAALLALWSQWWLNEHQIDDVVGAVAAHGPPAAWGVVSVALWARPHCNSSLRGLAFGGGLEALELLGVQVAGLVVLIAFVGASVYLAVVGIHVLFGFRCSRASELIGLDFMVHGFDDGSFGTDANKATVISESVMRECLAQRMVRHLSPTKSYAFSNSPFKAYLQNQRHSDTYARSADNIPPTAPDGVNVDSPCETTSKPGAEHPFERIPDEPRACQSSGEKCHNMPSEEELALEVAALRATVAALGQELAILSAAACVNSSARQSQAALGAFGSGLLAEVGRVGALRQLLADAEETAAAQAGRQGRRLSDPQPGRRLSDSGEGEGDAGHASRTV